MSERPSPGVGLIEICAPIEGMPTLFRPGEGGCQSIIVRAIDPSGHYQAAEIELRGKPALWVNMHHAIYWRISED